MLPEAVTGFMDCQSYIDAGHVLYVKWICVAKLPVFEYVGMKRDDVKFAFLARPCRRFRLPFPIRNIGITIQFGAKGYVLAHGCMVSRIERQVAHTLKGRKVLRFAVSRCAAVDSTVECLKEVSDYYRCRIPGLLSAHRS